MQELDGLFSARETLHIAALTLLLGQGLYYLNRRIYCAASLNGQLVNGPGRAEQIADSVAFYWSYLSSGMVGFIVYAYSAQHSASPHLWAWFAVVISRLSIHLSDRFGAFDCDVGRAPGWKARFQHCLLCLNLNSLVVVANLTILSWPFPWVALWLLAFAQRRAPDLGFSILSRLGALRPASQELQDWVIERTRNIDLDRIVPRVLVWEVDNYHQAFANKMVNNIVVTRALVNRLDDGQFKAIVAHELGHILLTGEGGVRAANDWIFARRLSALAVFLLVLYLVQHVTFLISLPKSALAGLLGNLSLFWLIWLLRAPSVQEFEGKIGFRCREDEELACDQFARGSVGSSLMTEAMKFVYEAQGVPHCGVPGYPGLGVRLGQEEPPEKWPSPTRSLPRTPACLMLLSNLLVPFVLSALLLAPLTINFPFSLLNLLPEPKQSFFKTLVRWEIEGRPQALGVVDALNRVQPQVDSLVIQWALESRSSQRRQQEIAVRAREQCARELVLYRSLCFQAYQRLLEKAYP